MIDFLKNTEINNFLFYLSTLLFFFYLITNKSRTKHTQMTHTEHWFNFVAAVVVMVVVVVVRGRGSGGMWGSVHPPPPNN
jgi:hypothetical protein